MSENKKMLLYVILLCVLPMAIMLPFAIIYERYDFLEIILVIVGCIELLAVNLRNTRRERKNVKKYGRYLSKSGDDGYDEYKSVQNMLLISGIVNLLVSVVVFFVVS